MPDPAAQEYTPGKAGTVSAVVLGAGQSRRMGRPKLILPWGGHTVIAQIIATILQAGIADISVVVGPARALIEAALVGFPVRIVENPDAEKLDMLSSLQAGISAQTGSSRALLVFLGDQPQVEEGVIRSVIQRYSETCARLVAPSYQMRRGHPWLVERCMWAELLHLNPGKTMRDFLNAHGKEIEYIEVDTPSILQDLDTPEDYRREKPPTG
jgi:molybdenum cofactor cytidylyltransferase